MSPMPPHTPWPHVSVLLDEVVAALAPKDGERFVDCTLGMGGHTEALLDAADCRVIGLDRDPQALHIASERLARFGDRVTLVHARFGDLAEVLVELGVDRVDGVLADFGVSSLQLDRADRGFSFQAAGPVDMRMDPSSDDSAAALIASVDEDALFEILRDLGEERNARRIARAIVAGRPFEDTLALARAVEEAIPAKARHRSRIHPATRAFQALRIAVNDELGEIDRLLPAASQSLALGGRLAFISFHSLEDRRVKRFLDAESGYGAPKDAYGHPLVTPRLTASRKAIQASEDDPNPRARSARLRTAVRTS